MKVGQQVEEFLAREVADLRESVALVGDSLLLPHYELVDAEELAFRVVAHPGLAMAIVTSQEYINSPALHVHQVGVGGLIELDVVLMHDRHCLEVLPQGLEESRREVARQEPTMLQHLLVNAVLDDATQLLR
jgi:hypothetical protein